MSVEDKTLQDKTQEITEVLLNMRDQHTRLSSTLEQLEHNITANEGALMVLQQLQQPQEQEKDEDEKLP
jgi:uncharacterized protein YigA (DUF484 family)